MARRNGRKSESKCDIRNNKNLSGSRGRDGSYDKQSQDNRKDANYSNSCNDPSWYTHNPVLADSVAQLSYNISLGEKVSCKWAHTDASGNVDVVDKYEGAFPGVMALHIAPRFGTSEERSSAVNLAAQNIYSFVRHVNSGSRNYEPADLMMYIMAVDQLYAYHQWIMRIYGYMNTASSINKYIPRGYAKADGIDFDDVYRNMSEFYQFINRFGAQISTLYVPAGFDVVKRHAFMYSSLYSDENNLKPQTYMFVPTYFYKFNPTTSTGSGLTARICYQDTPMTMSDIMDLGMELLNACLFNEDIGVMSGDILKAYQTSELLIAPAMPMDFTVIPVYNEEILMQIHNATIVPQASSMSSYAIRQEDGAIIDVVPCPPSNRMFTEPLVDFPMDAPTTGDVMVGLQLTAVLDYNSTTKATKVIHGTTIVTKVKVYSYDPSVITDGVYNIAASNMNSSVYNLAKPAEDTTTMAVLGALFRISAFGYCPVFYMSIGGTTASARVRVGETHNTAVVPADVLKRIHEVATLSQFGL